MYGYVKQPHPWLLSVSVFIGLSKSESCLFSKQFYSFPVAAMNLSCKRLIKQSDGLIDGLRRRNGALS